MDQIGAAYGAERFSLTDGDLYSIRSALAHKLGGWSLETETGDEGELYGRILPPEKSSRYSAFLLEREDDVIILTDNLSEPGRFIAAVFADAVLAMDVALNIIREAGGRQPAKIPA